MTVFSVFLVGFLVFVVADVLVSEFGRSIGEEVGDAVERALSKRH